MAHTARSLFALVLALCVLAFVPVQAGAQQTPGPGAFLENVGQMDATARFVTHSGGMTAWLTPDAIVLRVAEGRDARAGRTDPRSAARHEAELARDRRAVNLFLRFPGASGEVQLMGRQRSPARHAHYGPEARSDDVPAWGSVVYEGLYPGIDLHLTTTAAGLEYDVIVAPGADLGRFAVELEGADGLRANGPGVLEAATSLGVLRQDIPAAWHEDASGVRQPVSAFFTLAGNRFALGVEARDASRRLVVDPGLIFSSYLGGSAMDTGTSIAIDGLGGTYALGYTESASFPTVPGPTTLAGGVDIYVSKFDPTGSTLVYSDTFGGSAFESSWKIFVDGTGSAYVGGETLSVDWPTTPGAYSTVFAGGTSDAIVFKLTPAGTLDWSTFMGGALGIYDFVNAITVDAAGAVLVTGGTYSSDFPVTAGALDTTFNGVVDTFVSKLDPTGSTLVWSTFVGGVDEDRPFGIDVDDTGVYIAGYTLSVDYPFTASAFDTTYNGGGDGCVTKLTLDGSMPLTSTFLGSPDFESCNELDVDFLTTVFVTGSTDSAAFPVTVGAFDTTFNGVEDVFVTDFTPALDGLYYSTYLGGSGEDVALDIAVDICGRPSVTGWTYSADYPVTAGSLGPVANGIADAFVSQLDFLGYIYNYGAYLGGASSDFGNGIVVDETLRAYLSGTTISFDFPTTPLALDTTYNLGGDAWVSKVEFPWLNEMFSLAGTTEPKLIGDGSLAPSSDIALVLLDSLPSSLATLVVGISRVDAPFKGGVLVPATTMLVTLVTSPSGSVTLTGTWPAGVPAGVTIYYQYWAKDVGGPAGYQASNALSSTTP